MGDLITKWEAARILGVHVNRVYWYRTQGLLEGHYEMLEEERVVKRRQGQFLYDEDAVRKLARERRKR
jgi:hypothetical protein